MTPRPPLSSADVCMLGLCMVAGLLLGVFAIARFLEAVLL